MLVWRVVIVMVFHRIEWEKWYLGGRCLCRREETYVGRAKQMAGELQLLLASRGDEITGSQL